MSRVLIISDLHAPFEHPKALQFIEKTVNKYKCNRIVSIGDLADFHAYSLKWGPDPNGRSPGDEYELLMESLQPWYKAFPEMEIVNSNHDSRPYKKLFAASLPRQLMKSIGEFLHSPKGWLWHEAGTDIDGVYYFHGEGLSQANWRLAHEKYKTSVVHGHLHNSAGVHYHQDRKRRYAVLNTGCLIDEKQYCFRYSEHNFNRAVIGCGVVLDAEQFLFEPMPLKWL